MLAERLRQLRKEAQLSQDDVSKVIGLTKSAYGYYESGRNTPTVDNLVKLAKFYDVTTDYLMGQTDNKLGYGQYIQAASTPLGDITKLSKEDLDEINAIIEYKIRRHRSQSD